MSFFLNGLEIFTYRNLEQLLFDFYSNYEVTTLQFSPDKRGTRPSAKGRVCRFCKQPFPLVKFKKWAHVIPELLGNKNLVTFDECDSCNSIFSKYEVHLARFMGLDRTLFQTKGKNGVPKFNTDENGFTAEVTDNLGLKDIVELVDISGEHFTINKDTGDTEIRYQKVSYIPIKVYKAMLKIAINLLPQNELIHYEDAIKMILTDKYDYILAQYAVIRKYSMDEHFNVHAYLCKSRGNKSLPTHIFQLAFENMTFQLFIPFSKLDLHLYKRITMTPIFCPPIFFGAKPSSKRWFVENIPLQDQEYVIEKCFLRLEFEPNTIKDIHSINPKTGKESDIPFLQTKIKRIIISKEDFNININTLGNDQTKNEN